MSDSVLMENSTTLSSGACCQAELPKALVPCLVIGSPSRQELSSLASFALHQSCTLLSRGAKGDASSDVSEKTNMPVYMPLQHTDADAASVSRDELEREAGRRLPVISEH